MTLYVVEEKRHQRWTFTVAAETPMEARRLAAQCGFVEPATVRVKRPEPRAEVKP